MKGKSEKEEEEIILLEDLAPCEEIKGSHKRFIFGEQIDPPLEKINRIPE
ncbi:MAG: hypothetical protein QXH91_04200 [Candidatus Bathyarchaeia archaeon]